jgi:hypothetical protein
MNKSDISSPTESTDSGIQINMEQTARVCIDDKNLSSGWERFEGKILMI